MSLTRGQIRNNLYKRGFGLGFARTATSVASDGIVDAVAFSDSNAAEGNFVGTYIYRPLVTTAANTIRQAGVVSSTKLTHGGLAYSGDAAVLGYEVVGMLHPDELNEAIRLGLRRVYVEGYTPLNVLWTDGDFASSSASTPFDWTAVASGTTVTKSSTTGQNDVGKYSLVLTNTGTTHSSSFYVEPGDIIVHGTSARVTATTATATYNLLNVTASTTLETVTLASSLSFQHSLRITTIPTGCYEIQAEFGVSGSGTPVAVFDYSFGHPSGRESGQINMPSWLSQKARLIDFGPAEYGRATGSLQYDASSRRWLSDERVTDYELYPFLEESQQYKLQVNREGGLEDRDYWLHGWRQESDFVDLTDETSTTNAREDIVMAASLYEVADKLYYKTSDARWLQMKADAKVELDAQTRSERPAIAKRERTVYVPGGRV